MSKPILTGFLRISPSFLDFLQSKISELRCQSEFELALNWRGGYDLPDVKFVIDGKEIDGTFYQDITVIAYTATPKGTIIFSELVNEFYGAV